MKIVTLSAWLFLLTGLARAQDTNVPGSQDAAVTNVPAGAVCNPKKTDCGCEHNWGCWELIYTSKGTVLGGKVATLHVWGDRHNRLDASAQTTYFTEHFGTHHNLAGHVLAFGAIGGGSAGTEASIAGAIDFGFRSSMTDTSGLFLRAGPSGSWLGDHRLRLGLLEPLESRIGYQLLDGDKLFEWGLTFGPVLAGRYDVEEARRDLRSSSQLRSYFVVRFSKLRLDSSLANVRAPATPPGSSVWISRSMLCVYPRPLVGCLEVLYVAGAAQLSRATPGTYPTLHSLYGGLSIGLTP